MLNQLQKQRQLVDPMSQIYLGFNTLVKTTVNAHWSLPDWSGVPFNIALAIYQANHYVERYKLNHEDFNQPQDVFDYCQQNGLIGSKQWSFPKVKNKPNGMLLEFSPKQYEFINDRQPIFEDAGVIKTEPLLEFNCGSVRSGKTQSAVFKMAHRYCDSTMGRTNAIVGWSYSVISRIAVKGENTLLDILPFADVVKIDNESSKLIFPSLFYPFDPVEVYLIPVNNKRSYSNILGLSLDSLYLIELSEICKQPDTLIELNSRTLASPTRYILADSNPVIDAGMNSFVKMFSQLDDITISNHFYKYRHWSLINHDNPTLTDKQIQDIISQYAHDPHLLATKIYGEFRKQSGLVLTGFSNKNKLDSMPLLDKLVSLTCFVDYGHIDGSVAQMYLTGTKDGKFKHTLIAEYYHKQDVWTNTPKKALGPKAPSELAYEMLTFYDSVTTAVREYYETRLSPFSRRFVSEDIYVDPSALGLMNELKTQQERHHLSLTGSQAVAIRKADNGSRERINGIETQFMRLNDAFHKERLFIYCGDELFSDGTYSTTQTIRENENYTVDKNGEIIKKGKGHGDCVHVERYAWAELRSFHADY